MGDVADLEAEQEMHEARRRPRRTGTEQEWRLHSAAARLCYRRERADPDFRFFSPGAEGARNAARAAISQMMGQNRRGVLDMVLLRRNPTGMCMVEFKTAHGKLSPDQQDWCGWLPFPVHVVRSIDAFRLILDAF